MAVLMLAAAGFAAVLVWLVASGSLKSSCAYGSGRSAHSCRSRPEPGVAERAAAANGSALAGALEAFRRSPEAAGPLVGVGVNRWGEVTFAIATGKTGFGIARERFVRLDAQGKALGENAQAQYEDAIGSVPFTLDQIRPEILRRATTRIDRPRGFTGARLEPSFGNTGLAWRLTFVARGEDSATMFAMSAAGEGLCRLNDSSASAGVPPCNLARLPATAFAQDPAPGTAAMRRAPALAPAADPALQKQIAQMNCVKKAQGNVTALRRCVE